MYKPIFFIFNMIIHYKKKFIYLIMEKYYCGISLNKISKLIKAIHLYDNKYCYHGSFCIKEYKTDRIFFKTAPYDFYFPISKDLFNEISESDFYDLNNISLNNFLKKFSIYNIDEWII